MKTGSFRANFRGRGWRILRSIDHQEAGEAVGDERPVKRQNASAKPARGFARELDEPQEISSN